MRDSTVPRALLLRVATALEHAADLAERPRDWALPNLARDWRELAAEVAVLLRDQATGGQTDERDGAGPPRDDAMTPAGFADTTPARGPVEAGTTCAIEHTFGADGSNCGRCGQCFHCFPADWRGNISGPCEKCGKAIEEGRWWVTAFAPPRDTSPGVEARRRAEEP